MKSLTKFNYRKHSAKLRSEQQRSWFGFGAKRPNQTAAAHGSVAEWKKTHVLDAKRSTRGAAAGLFGAQRPNPRSPPAGEAEQPCQRGSCS